MRMKQKVFIAITLALVVASPLFWPVVESARGVAGSYEWFGESHLPDRFGAVGSGTGRALVIRPSLYSENGAEMTAFFKASDGLFGQCLGGRIHFDWERVRVELWHDPAVVVEELEFPLIGIDSPELVIPATGDYIEWNTEVEQQIMLGDGYCLNLAGGELAAGPARSLPIEIEAPWQRSSP